jgi:hypothetical protein
MQMTNYGYVYKTTFLKTGLIYVGQHMASEWDDNYIGSGRIIRELIKEYGKVDQDGNPNFKCELIEWSTDQELLNEREIYWINALDARNPAIGYNIAYGGKNMKGGHTPETLAALSATKTGKVYVYLGAVCRRVSPEEAEELYYLGWRHGRTHGRTHKAICLETGEIWPTVNHLAKAVGAGEGSLSFYLDTRPYRGKHYCYLETYESWSEEQRVAFLARKTNNPRKAVFCIELNRSFASIKAASLELGIARSQIRGVCLNRRGFDSAGGYHWKFIETEES